MPNLKVLINLFKNASFQLTWVFPQRQGRCYVCSLVKPNPKFFRFSLERARIGLVDGKALLLDKVGLLGLGCADWGESGGAMQQQEQQQQPSARRFIPMPQWTNPVSSYLELERAEVSAKKTREKEREDEMLTNSCFSMMNFWNCRGKG